MNDESPAPAAVGSSNGGYLLTGQPTELERLQLQSRVWEPAGRELLAELGEGRGRRALDVGCGVLGWLRVLSEWVGPTGEVVGTDIDTAMLAGARTFADAEELSNVELIQDDLFSSELPPATFDLVHARFQLAPLGRATEQLTAYRRLVRPGGLLVLEDPDSGTWQFNPPAAAGQRLITLVLQAFSAAGGDFDAGRALPTVMAEAGLEPQVRSSVQALPAGHPYLRVPIQFSVALEQRLSMILPLAELRALRAAADVELANSARWGTTFTLIQAWARIDN